MIKACLKGQGQIQGHDSVTSLRAWLEFSERCGDLGGEITVSEREKDGMKGSTPRTEGR